MLIKEYEPLAPQTTLQVGGAARFYIETTTIDSLTSGLVWAKTQQLSTFLLGGGSNILVSDQGFAGVVVRHATNTLASVTIAQQTEEFVTFRVNASAALDSVVHYCVQEGWAGLECLSGIPGTLG